MPSYSVTDFVSACRSLSKDSLTADNAQVLRQVTEQQMPEQYRMPFPEALRVQPKSSENDPERHLRGLWHELAQHLRDLHYLTEKEFKAYHKHKNLILEDPALLQPVLVAVKNYLPEEKEWEELEEILPTSRSVDLLWLSKHLSIVVDRIGLHTCWDGSILIPDAYTVGEKTVFGRALAFRLRTLSSTDYRFPERSKYYTESGNVMLNKLCSKAFSLSGKATKTDVPSEFWTALGNIDDLVVYYVNSVPKKRDLTMLYQLAPEKGETQLPLEDFKKGDIDPMDADAVEYDTAIIGQIVRRARAQKNRSGGGLDLRLVQIKLWQAGYYIGAIDGKWDKLSHTALNVFVQHQPLTIAVIEARKKEREQIRELRIKDIDNKWRKEKKTLNAGSALRKERRKEKNALKKQINKAASDADKNDVEAYKKARLVRSSLVVINRENKVYAADFKVILEYLGVDLRARAKEVKLLNEAELINKLQSAPGVSQDTFDEKILKEEDVGKLYPNNYKKPKRRVSFFRKLGGFIVGGITRIAKWLAETAKKALDVVLGPVFSFIKKLLRPIRAAIHRFFQGFKYLANFVLGKPLLTVTKPATATELPRIFATKFQLDFDSINLVPSDAEPEEAILHSNHIHKMRQDMSYFVGSVVWIIKAIGKLLNPGGWVWLGWQMVKGVAQMVGGAKKKEALV